MTKGMSEQDLVIATALLSGATLKVASAKAGVTERTVHRRLKEPYFLAYMEKNRDVVREKMVAKAEAKVEQAMDRELAKIPFSFTFADAANRYNEIYTTSKNDFCRLKAVDSLVNLFGVAKPVEAPGEQAAEGPDVYQAAWMRKTQ